MSVTDDKPDTPRPPAPSPTAPQPRPELTESETRALLERLSEGAHTVGVTAFAIDDDLMPDVFKLTPKEIDELAPPITRIVNRHRVLSRYVAKSDEAMVALTLLRYTVRTGIDARAAVAMTNAMIPPEQREEVDRGEQRAEVDRPAAADGLTGGSPDPGAPNG